MKSGKKSTKKATKSTKPKYNAKAKNKPSTAVPVAVKAYVKKAIHAQIENKQATPNGGQFFISQYTPKVGTTPSITPSLISLHDIFTGIGQGTGQGDRIGNKIKPLNTILKGWVSISTLTTDPPSLSFYQYNLKMVIGKLNKQLTQPLNTDFDEYFQFGNSQHPPQSDMFDLLRNPNKDKFQIMETRLFKVGFQNGSGATVPINWNNDYKSGIPFYINLNKHLSTIKYNDTEAEPTNTAIYMWFFMCNADGSSIGPPDFPAKQQILLTYEMQTTYEDA